MARLGRKGRILKWAGLVVCLLTMSVWAASMRWEVDGVSADAVQTVIDRVPGPYTYYSLHSATLLKVKYGELDYHHFVRLGSPGPPGWSVRRIPRFKWYLPGLPYVRMRPNGWREAMVPLWMIILILSSSRSL